MQKPVSLEGVMPAVVTPFLPDGSLDEDGLRQYVTHVVELPGVSGILCAGYTGEGSSLTQDEKVRVVEICADVIGGEIPLIAGIDVPSTGRAIADGVAVRDAGASVLQINSPYYGLLRRGFLSSPDASVEFFERMVEGVQTPMTVFQYPSWSGLTYSPETIGRLAGVDLVVGIKEAVDLDTYIDDLEAARGRVSIIADNNTYTLLSMLFMGADGTMVGISNVGTELYVDLFEAVRRSDRSAAVDLMNAQIAPLMQAFARDLGRTRSSFVARIKAALVLLGLIKYDVVRGPDMPATRADYASIEAVLANAGLARQPVQKLS